MDIYLCFCGVDKVMSIVGNYEHYAQEVGITAHWIQKITEEVGYRIGNVTGD